jgi:hypothetical protein
MGKRRAQAGVFQSTFLHCVGDGDSEVLHAVSLRGGHPTETQGETVPPFMVMCLPEALAPWFLCPWLEKLISQRHWKLMAHMETEWPSGMGVHLPEPQFSHLQSQLVQPPQDLQGDVYDMLTSDVRTSVEPGMSEPNITFLP